MEKYTYGIDAYTLKALLNSPSPVDYQGDKYSIDSFEGFQTRNLEILKQEKTNAFASFPLNKAQWEKGYNQAQVKKTQFFISSIVPRKSDRSVDWVKWYQDEHAKLSKARFTVAKAKKYIREKANPALQNWADNFGKPHHSDPTARLTHLNQQIDEYLNINLNAFGIVQASEKELGKDGLLTKSKNNKYFDSIVIEDASGNKIELKDIQLVVKYDTIWD